MKLRSTAAGRNLWVLMGMLMYIFMGNMLSIFSRSVPYRDMLGVAVTCIGCFMLFYVLFRFPIPQSSILFPLLGFTMIALLASGFYFFVQTSTSTSYAIRLLSESVRWVAVFSWSYYIGFLKKDMVISAKIAAFAIVLFGALFLGVKEFSANRGIPLISTAYYALFLLPFALLFSNKLVKWSLVACIFYTLLLSMKRTGFIAFVLGVFCYLVVDIIVNNRIDKRKGRVKVIAAILVSVAFIVLLGYITEGQEISVLDRMESIEEDGGSGRTEVWAHTWEMIKNSDFASLVLGHGYNTVYMNSKLGISAHTDVLEVLYDYGILGTVLYAWFYVKIWGHFRRTFARKTALAGPFAASLALALSNSAASHLVILPTHFLFLCVFWGLIAGENERADSVTGGLA